MDSNVTEKLNNFTALVMRDAQAKREKLLSEVQKEYNDTLEQKENELLEGAYEDIQKTVNTARRKAGERVLHTELDSRKTLIKRREEMIDEVMTEARERLVEFTKSADYEKWLIEKAEKGLNEVGDGVKTIYISSADMRFANKIKALADGNITIEEIQDTGYIGGIRIVNTDRHVAADYSISEMLSEEKKRFLQTSGLSLS